MGTGRMDADWSGFHYLMEKYIDTFFFPCLNALFLYNFEHNSPVNLGIFEAQHQTNCNRIVFNTI